MRFNHKIKLIIFLSSLMMGTLEPVLASSAPLEGFTRGIADFFNLTIFSSDPKMQVGFLRFLLWILLFAIIFWVGESFVFKTGENPRRIAGIVGAIISLISVIFMPEAAVIAIGTAYSAAIFTILVIGIAAGAVYMAFGVLKSEKGKSEWWKELFGLLVLIIGILIMETVLVVMFGEVYT